MTVDGPWFMPARAKLNLLLRIVGRRGDGYHLLHTLFHTLWLHDDVVLERTAGGLSIAVTADDERLLAPAGPDNLAVRALAALQAATGDRGGFHVRLHKRIPHGAGLGGGSSDAAAALRLGNAALGAPVAAAELTKMAARLGADVAFFLRGGTQWGRGVGDELTPAADVRAHFVLAVPPFGCNTAEVYKIHAQQWQGTPAPVTVRQLTVPDIVDAVVGIGFGNDLEAAAEVLQPELGRLRRAVAVAGYPQVRMTGSGSTLFVAVASAAEAERCCVALRPLFPSPGGLIVTESGPAIDVDRPRQRATGGGDAD